MAVIETATLNQMVQQVQVDIDVSSPGTAVFESASDTEVATVTFAGTSFGAAAAGVITAGDFVPDASATGGTIDHVSFYDGASTKVLEATIAITNSQDFEISSLDINAGDQVDITGCTVTLASGA